MKSSHCCFSGSLSEKLGAGMPRRQCGMWWGGLKAEGPAQFPRPCTGEGLRISALPSRLSSCSPIGPSRLLHCLAIGGRFRASVPGLLMREGPRLSEASSWFSYRVATKLFPGLCYTNPSDHLHLAFHQISGQGLMPASAYWAPSWRHNGAVRSRSLTTGV